MCHKQMVLVLDRDVEVAVCCDAEGRKFPWQSKGFGDNVINT